VIDRSMTLEEFGRDYIAGASRKRAKSIVFSDGIPYQRVGNHILIRESDAEAWRESHVKTPEAPNLKSLLAEISARVLKERKRP
jgi:hypothetical protein